MPLKTGTADISTLLAVKDQSAVEFGLDTIAQVLAADVAAHNTLVDQMMADFADPSTDRQRRAGTSLRTQMIEVDEYGRAPTQRETPGQTVAFPLKKFAYAIGWTNDWFKVHTPADMAAMAQASQKAHLLEMQRQLKLALYLSANYTFNDFLIDQVDLAVKRLVNADSAKIPDGPNGEQYDGATHSHYNGSATLTNTAALALVQDVAEHGHTSQVKIAINIADESAWRGLTDFKPYVDPRLTLNSNANQPTTRLDIARIDNRAIGLFGAAEVWVKPWAPANYAFCWASGDGRKPLVFRQRPQQTLRGLRIAATLPTFPLLAEYMEAEFGFGVWERTNGAVLYSANATYADPAI